MSSSHWGSNMSLANTSINLSAQTLPCSYVGKYHWRQQYLTQTVYYNIVATIFANALICPAIVVCNASVIFCVVTEPRLRRTKSNVLLSLLAVTDLAVGAIVCPLFIASFSCRISGQCDYSCQIDTAAFFLLIACSCSTLFHLVLIALDRFIAIKLALRYKALVTTRKIVTGTVVVWTVAFVYSLFPIYSSRVANYLFFPLGAIPILVICSCYASVYVESRKHNKNIQAQLPQGQQHNSRRHEFKAAKTTFIVTASVLIYIIPPVIVTIIKLIFIDTSTAETSKTSFYFTRQVWLCTTIIVNSLSNPLIYSYRTQELRKATKKVLNRLRNHLRKNTKV